MTKGLNLDNIDFENLDFDSIELVDEPDAQVEMAEAPTEEIEEIEDLFENEETEETPTEEIEVEETEEIEIEQTENSLLSTFAEELKANGILPDVDDEKIKGIGSFEELLETLNEQLVDVQMKWQEEYKSNILKNLVAEGIIKEDQINFKDNKTFTKDDISDEDNAKALLEEYYKMKGLPEKRIKRLIDNSIDPEEDALDIFDDYKSLKKEEENKVAKVLEEREKREVALKQELDKKIKEETFKYSEFIPGQKVNDKVKQEVHESIPVVLNKINSDLAKYAPIIAYLDKYGLLDGDFSKIMKVKQTEAVNKFTEALKGGKSVSPSPNSLRKTALESIRKR